MESGVGTAYREGRDALTELLSGLSPGEWELPVPACPEWTVRDTVAHLVGVCADAWAGRLEGVTTEAWTAAQVEARRSADGAALLAEWSTEAPPLEELADGSGDALAQWVFDFVVHEQDLRAALGVPGGDGSARARIAEAWISAAFAAHLAVTGSAVAIDLAGLDLIRALSGRSPVEEVLGLVDESLDVDDLRALLTWGPFVPPART